MTLTLESVTVRLHAFDLTARFGLYRGGSLYARAVTKLRLVDVCPRIQWGSQQVHYGHPVRIWDGGGRAKNREPSNNSSSPNGLAEAIVVVFVAQEFYGRHAQRTSRCRATDAPTTAMAAK